MRQYGREIHDSGSLVDCRGLNGGDLMVAQGLAHDFEAARERGIAERLFSPARSI